MKLINLMVTLALIAGQSEAKSSSTLDLNLYGHGHLSFDYVDDGADRTQHVTSNSSRLGIKGQQKLSESLTFIFQYESGVDLTAQGGNDGNGGASSAGQLFTKGRPSFVGIEGAFGTVLVGHYNGLDQWANDFNYFADYVGDLGNLWEGSGLPGRVDNAIVYSTPTSGGKSVRVTYVPSEEGVTGETYIVKGDYQKDGLQLGLAYMQVGTLTDDTHSGIALTAKYQFSNYSLGFGYQQESDIQGALDNNRDSFSLGGAINLGDKSQLKLQYALSQSDAAESDAAQFAIGYDYAFNKNNTLYVALATMDNDANVNFSVNGKGHGDRIVPALGDDMATLSIGFISIFDAKFSVSTSD